MAQLNFTSQNLLLSYIRFKKNFSQKFYSTPIKFFFTYSRIKFVNSVFTQRSMTPIFKYTPLEPFTMFPICFLYTIHTLSVSTAFSARLCALDYGENNMVFPACNTTKPHTSFLLFSFCVWHYIALPRFLKIFLELFIHTNFIPFTSVAAHLFSHYVIQRRENERERERKCLCFWSGTAKKERTKIEKFWCG